MFDANGTEGLELFTWIVGGLIGFIAALTFTHFLAVQKEDEEISEEPSETETSQAEEKTTVH
ncbi:hypothetical protein [Tunicatimonas pelagia]|uniref:hypothetical protein n=1 Tax=Tunicatimonas pelagia TaxID=931531 RepID=UPI0026663CB2|nr:hypothetical protein [Tunicatimonas pelagia]WKN42489.1 hypothetical protein P0M28_25980 [Tunicatimonas pelagia]